MSIFIQNLRNISTTSLLIVLLLFMFMPLSGTAQDLFTLSGKVIGITDGDTITILMDDKKTIKVRLAEIDAPEKDQPYGNKAKQLLSNLVYNQEVEIKRDGKDRYGRLIGTVYLNKDNINLKIVQQGGAWAYREYLKDSRYIEAEDTARSTKIGLWALQSDQIVAPWEWRRKGLVKNNDPNTISACGYKRTCKQMISCDEAMFYMKSCGLYRLDGDRDGLPCENICR